MKFYIKNGLILALILICVIAMCFSFTACGKENIGNKTISLIIGEGENQVVFEDYKTDAEYLAGVLDELKNDGKISYTATDSTYGAYLTAINDLNEGGGHYVRLLSDVAEQQDIDEWAIFLNYKDTEFVSVFYGMSTLQIIDGASYMIALV